MMKQYIIQNWYNRPETMDVHLGGHMPLLQT